MTLIYWGARRMWPLDLSQLAAFCQAELLPEMSKEAHSTVFGLVTDSRKAAPGLLYVPLKGDRFDGLDFVGDVLSQKGTFALVPRGHLASQHAHRHQGTALLVDDVLLAFRLLAKRLRGQALAPALLAIGGSNGKTTTKEMVLAFLGGRSSRLVATRKSENGFIGIPKTLTSDEMTSEVSEIVLEVGIDETGSMQQHVDLISPDFMTLTSLSHEHLEGLGSFENVVAEEMALMKGQGVGIWQMGDPVIAEHARLIARKGDWLVFPDPLVQTETRESLVPANNMVRVFWAAVDGVNLSQSIRIQACFPDNSGGLTCESRFSIPIPGRHNAANSALAFACSLAFRMASWAEKGSSENLAALVQSLERSFKNFVPPEMRSNVERFNDGSVLLVDCYNSNPASLNASLETVQRAEFSGHKKILILGDMLDLGAESDKLHRELIFVLESMSDCQLYLYGVAMYPVYIELQKRQPQRGIKYFPATTSAEEMGKAIVFAPGQTLVLVKGSRGMAMERLLPGIRTELAQLAPP